MAGGRRRGHCHWGAGGGDTHVARGRVVEGQEVMGHHHVGALDDTHVEPLVFLLHQQLLGLHRGIRLLGGERGQPQPLGSDPHVLVLAAPPAACPMAQPVMGSSSQLPPHGSAPQLPAPWLRPPHAHPPSSALHGSAPPVPTPWHSPCPTLHSPWGRAQCHWPPRPGWQPPAAWLGWAPPRAVGPRMCWTEPGLEEWQEGH